MKILIAPDKFKGSLSAHEVCEALSKGLKKTNPNLEIIACPIADGGDGSLEVLAHYFDLKTTNIEVDDPLFRPINASYKMADTTAYIEMAAASGLVLLKEKERNCMDTSSFGTGELILDAIQKGATTIYLFIGGSATNDGGMGIASALGWCFYSKNGELLVPIGENLSKVSRIDGTFLFYKPAKVEFKIICDVNNPFYGENGAAYVYASQKGATTDEVKMLDQGLQNLSDIIQKEQGIDLVNFPGAGAAGGVGGGAIAFLNADLVSGIQTFIEITELEAQIKDCDLIITGEGKLDAQTNQGKVVSGVCDLAKKYGKPVIAVCGTADKNAIDKFGFHQIYTVLERSNSMGEAMTNAKDKLLEIGNSIKI